MKNLPQHLRPLADAFGSIFQKGLTLNPQTLHYIDSTFSTPSVKDLEEILCDDTHCEKESLLEMIFFLDIAHQVELEKILEGHDFTKKSEESLIKGLAARKLRTRLLFPNERGSLSLPVSGELLRSYISRLNISKKQNPVVVDAIHRHVPQAYQALCKVKLRNSRLKLTPEKASFLEFFFSRLAVDIKIVLKAYDFLLAFLEETEDDTDFYAALTRKKRFYFQNLQKALQFETRLKTSNIETLLLQGVRMPYFDTQEARRCIGIIDRICYAMYGRSELLENTGSPSPVELDCADDLETILKRLS